MTAAAELPKELEERALRVDGMDCASCVASVERVVRKIPGVRDIRVNLARGRAVVAFEPAVTNETTVAAAITAVGFPSEPEPEAQDAGAAEAARLARQAHEARQWLRRATVGGVLWIPAEGLHQFYHFTAHHPPHWVNWTTAILAAAALTFGAGKFYSSAYKSLKAGSANMDVLIAMGFTTAFIYSFVALVGWELSWWANLPSLYFAESAALLALISLGHYLEARARQGAGAAIRELLELAPSVALKVAWRPKRSLAVLGQDTAAAGGEPQEVRVADLAAGDYVLIRPGDRVPTDSQVVEGKSTLDESMLTGEAMPVLRSVGDNLTGGTVNGEGKLIARVTRVGSETALAQIVKLVETAQASKPPVQKLADKVAAVFVPAVLGIALFTGVGWFVWGLMHEWEAARTWGKIANAVCSVLLIACPCALGLAVPAALMVGTGCGAKRGILIRDIDGLQAAEKLSIVVLDKTGTVTAGKPTVTGTRVFGDISEKDLTRFIASIEASSAHPLAKSIVSHFRGGGLLPVTDFHSEPGIGLTAWVEARDFAVGGRALLANRAIPLPPAAPEGASEVFLVEGNNILGAIFLSDEVRPHSAKAVASLKSMGIDVVLLTGDNESSAQRAAAAVGITRVFANVRPEGKADRVRALQNEAKEKGGSGRGGGGGKVAMVGDGVNDAPALSAADVGIAIGSGSDVAKETGDIVLVGSSLESLVEAIELSRRTMRVIRQNLFLAFVYNVTAIPLAALGLLTPLIAAGAMALSDVSVLGNALRLRGSLKASAKSGTPPR